MCVSHRKVQCFCICKMKNKTNTASNVRIWHTSKKKHYQNIFPLCYFKSEYCSNSRFFYLTFSTIWFVCCQTNRRNWLVVCKRQNNKNSNRLRQLLCISHACYTHRDICYYEHSVRIEEKQSNNIQQFSRYIALTHTHTFHLGV